MVFASVVRSLELLQTTKLAFGGAKAESTFKQDLSIIAKATAADFERARAVLPNVPSLASVVAPPAVRENTAVQTALKHLLMSTATVPLTEGYKVATRHFGFFAFKPLRSTQGILHRELCRYVFAHHRSIIRW